MATAPMDGWGGAEENGSGIDNASDSTPPAPAQEPRSLDEIAAEIHEALGTTPPSDDEREQRVKRWEAQKTASICGRCFKPLGADGPVWRLRRTLGQSIFGGWHTRLLPHCETCAKPYWLFDEMRPKGLVTLSAFSCGECSGQQASCGGGCPGPSAE
jgi:hypothetical protein